MKVIKLLFIFFVCYMAGVGQVITIDYLFNINDLEVWHFVIAFMFNYISLNEFYLKPLNLTGIKFGRRANDEIDKEEHF